MLIAMPPGKICLEGRDRRPARLLARSIISLPLLLAMWPICRWRSKQKAGVAKNQRKPRRNGLVALRLRSLRSEP